MTSFRRLALAAALAAAATLPAQVVVDAGGGGTHTDLQAGINAAPPGGTVRVIGGVWTSVRINKSLTLTATPRAWITNPLSGLGFQQDALVEAVGTGTERLVLDNFLLSGQVDGVVFGGSDAALKTRGFAEVNLLHCDVLAPEWFQITGDAVGVVAVEVAGVAEVRISDSRVFASASDTCRQDHFGPDGVAGIDAPNATVTLMDSHVRGGAGSGMVFVNSPPANPCPCPGSGTGGVGIVADRLFNADSQVEPGAGGQAMNCRGGSCVPYGQQPDGSPELVRARVDLGGRLQALNRMRVGTRWQVITGYLSRGTMLLGVPASPQQIGSAWLFLDSPSIVAIPLTAQSPLFSIQIPNVPALAAGRFGAQIATVSLGQLTLSRPIVDMISF